MGAGIKYINENAFAGCSALTTFTIPDSVTVIKSCYWRDAYVDNVYTRNVLQEGNFSHGFEGCDKLGIAAQAAIKRRGYTGTFNKPER
jgi:hypothetical protein